MIEERDTLAKWHSRKIVVEDKHINLIQNINEVLYSFRYYLISKIIDNIHQETSKDSNVDNSTKLSEIMNYIDLKKVIALNAGNVIITNPV